MRRTLFAGRATCALHGLYCAAQRPHGHRKRGGAGHALLRACALTRAHTPQGLPVLLFTSSQASERASKRKTCICLNPGGDGGTEGRRAEERDRERGRGREGERGTEREGKSCPALQSSGGPMHQLLLRHRQMVTRPLRVCPLVGFPAQSRLRFWSICRHHKQTN